MSTGPNRILDEFAKLMTDAAGPRKVCGARSRPPSRDRPKNLNSMDVVQREEFEAAREMARQGACRKQGAFGPDRCARGPACGK